MKTLFELKCPSCNANLDYEEGMTFIFCKYCGTRILLDDTNNYTVKTIDLAEIEKARNESKRISMQEDLINREYEREKEDNSNYNKTTLIHFGVLGFISIIFFSSLL